MKLYHYGIINELKDPASLGKGFKPRGLCLWLTFNSQDWINWCSMEMPQWLKDDNFIYEIEVSGNFITQVDMMKYKVSPKGLVPEFDFDKMKADGFDGFIVEDPYYPGWYGYDIPQYCIWNMNGVKIIDQVKSMSPLFVLYEDFLKELRYSGNWQESGEWFISNQDNKKVQVVYSAAEGITLNIITDEKQTKNLTQVEGVQINSYLYSN